MIKTFVSGLVAAALAAAPAAAASMSVQTFLVRAEALKMKGPLALFSSDIKLLTNQIKGDGAALRAERLAAKRAGRAPAYCPPDKVALSNQNVIDAMQAVPPAQRASTDTRTALRAYMARRYPCRG